MLQRMRGLYLLPLMTLALLVVSLMQPLSAGAASLGKIHLFKTKLQASPNAGVGNLQYHGGPVMGGTARAYAIFWEPGGSYVSSTYNSLILQYFGDVGGSSLYHSQVDACFTIVCIFCNLFRQW